MFKVGDYVVNSKNGVCKIEDIQRMDISGENKEYFLLIPLAEQSAKVYIPVDAAPQRIRYAMDKEQALNLIRKMKTVEELYIDNERNRESIYKDVLKGCDPILMVSAIKTLYLRREDRLNEGKKTTAVDEHYFKLAEKHLHNELAFALQVSIQEVTQIILKNI